MTDLLIFCLLTSLKITAVHVSFWTGNIFFDLRNKVGKFLYNHHKLSWLEKPLYDCLPCMASIWGLLFWLLEGMNFPPVDVILIVCGINCLIERVVFETPKIEG